MLKIVINIEEKEPNNISLFMDKITEDDFNNSSQNEKIAAFQVKNAIEVAVHMMSMDEKGRGKNEKKRRNKSK